MVLRPPIEDIPKLSRVVGPGNGRPIDPPLSALTLAEDQIMILVASGDYDVSLLARTQIGTILEMPKGNRPERGLTCERD